MDKLEKIKKMMENTISNHSWSEDSDYDGGSMSEANDIGWCHGQTKLAQDILNIINETEK